MDEIRLASNSYIMRFSASDGVRLNGLFTSDAKRPKTCVIFIHGMGGGAFSHIALSLADNLPKNLALFSINTRGQAAVSRFSRYVRGRRRSVMGGTCLERFEDSIFDIKGAIAALSRRGYRNFVLCGHSTGCQKVTYYQYKTKDRRVKGLVLVAPLDDYNMYRIMLGRVFAKAAAACAKMIKSGKGDQPAPRGGGFSAQRLDSIINPKRIESRLFNYDTKLKEFGSIRTPILAVLGDREENVAKAVEEYLSILESRTSSVRFSSLLVAGAGHSFDGKERELASNVYSWIEDL